MTIKLSTITTLAMLIAFASVSGAEGVMVAIETQQRSAPPSVAAAPKLSPALAAVKASGGVLKGSDDSGRPVLLVPNKLAIAALQKSPAVERKLDEVPLTWNRVRRLKISYKTNQRPSEEELTKLGLRTIEDYQKGSFLIVETVNREVDAKLADELDRSKQVRYATLSVPINAIPPIATTGVSPVVAEVPSPPTNDPRWDVLWGMRNINAPKAWTTIHDSTVIVAVIDTGVDYGHTDLSGNMWKDSAGAHGYDFVDNDADPMDLHGHGTHCAGTVGAVGNNGTGVVGVNWHMQIMALRWLNSSGSGEIVDAIKAIDFAVDHGAKVLSNSWYWPEDDPDLLAVIQRAHDAGVLFVSAAGNFAELPNNNKGDNDKVDTRGRLPSAYELDNIVAVAAINPSDKLTEFSEWGKRSVDLGAPGESIMSTVPQNGYDGTFSGTSMATPHVAGALALAWSKDPEASYAAIKQRVLERARKVPEMKNRCVTDGVLDISFLGE